MGQFVGQRKKQDAEGRRFQQKKARDNFKQMLEVSHLSPHFEKFIFFPLAF